MAKYRQVHTTFWDDGFVLDLTPEEKYFYLYLMTNNNTTQCGIYELPYRTIEMQTGYNRETVLKLLKRFVDYGKILYNEPTKEIMILNWAKYNFINSPKVRKCIEKELQEVKYKPFIKTYINLLKQYGYGIDTVSIPYDEQNGLESSNINGSIPYQYHMDSPSIDLGEEEEQEEEKEEEKEEEQEEEQEQEVGQSVSQSSDFGKLATFYEQNIGPLLPVISQELGDIYDTYKDANLIQEAFKIAIHVNAKNKMKYAEGILKNWKAELITSYEQLKAKEAREENAKSQRSHANGQISRNHEKNATEIPTDIDAKLRNFSSI